MCVVSFIGDTYNDFYRKQYQWYQGAFVPPPALTKEDLKRLEAKVDEMIAMLRAALEYDKENGTPQCQVEEKMARLRQIAALVGVDLDAVLELKKEEGAMEADDKRTRKEWGIREGSRV